MVVRRGEVVADQHLPVAVLGVEIEGLPVAGVGKAARAVGLRIDGGLVEHQRPALEVIDGEGGRDGLPPEGHEKERTEGHPLVLDEPIVTGGRIRRV